MKVLMQRVTSASVRVEGKVVGEIGKGLLCFVGIGHDDTEDDAEWCCRRLLVQNRTVSQHGRPLNYPLTNPNAMPPCGYMLTLFKNAHLWPDESDRAWKTSLKSNGYEVLVVSQFTLHGQFAGNKPDFHLASTSSTSQLLCWVEMLIA